MKNDKKVIIGLWKFRNTVGRKDLLEVARKWAEDDKYLQVYIRQTSKDQDGIGFVYAYDGAKSSYEEYFEKASDALKREFGNDLVGWDISSDAELIKGI